MNALPSGWTTNEDTAVPLTGISISDVDAKSGVVSVTLSVTPGSGTLLATSGGGVTVANSGTDTLTLSGSLDDVGRFLAGAAAPVYVPTANIHGDVTLSVTTNDGGNTGSGGALSDTDTATITIDAVNDAPVNTIPAGWTTAEDTQVTLSGLAVADIDSGSGTMTVTLSVTSGALTGSNGSGVTVSGSGTTALTLSGTRSQLNTFLSETAPRFMPGADFFGTVSLTMTVDDGGNTGLGGALSDVDVAAITVTPVNDARILSCLRVG